MEFQLYTFVKYFTVSYSYIYFGASLLTLALSLNITQQQIEEMARLSHTVRKRVGNARQFHAQILAAMAEVGISSWLKFQLLLIRLLYL